MTKPIKIKSVEKKDDKDGNIYIYTLEESIVKAFSLKASGTAMGSLLYDDPEIIQKLLYEKQDEKQEDDKGHKLIIEKAFSNIIKRFIEMSERGGLKFNRDLVEFTIETTPSSSTGLILKEDTNGFIFVNSGFCWSKLELLAHEWDYLQGDNVLKFN